MDTVTRSERPPSEYAFDRVATVYDSWFETPLGHRVDQLEKDLLYGLAQPRLGERALDVGAGTGYSSLDLAALGLSVVAVDLSAPMLDVARAKGAAVQLLRGDAATLPLASESFDLVLSVTALEFFARPQDALDEMWRVVRPGGRLVVGVLNDWSPWARARRRESRQQETPFSHAHFYTPGEFVRALRRLGAVTWSSSVFVGPGGRGLRWAWQLERVGRALLKPFGALLVGRIIKWE